MVQMHTRTSSISGRPVRRVRSASGRGRAVYIEALESRVLLAATLLPIADHNDLVFDPVRNVLNVVSGDGNLYRYNLTTGQMLPSIWLGGKPGRGDITPDGKYLFVTDWSGHLYDIGNERKLHKVDLAAGTSTVISYWSYDFYEAYTSDIAILSDSKALFSSYSFASGTSYALRTLDLATGAVENAPAPLTNLTPGILMYRSADRSTLLLNDLNEGNPVSYYDVASNAITSKKYVSWGWWGYWIAAVSGDGRLVATTDRSAGQTFVDDYKGGSTHVILPGGATYFSPVYNTLYLLRNQSQTVEAYDTGTFALKARFDLGEMFSYDVSGETHGIMTASADGKRLFVTTLSGVRVLNVDESAAGTAVLAVSKHSTVAGEGLTVAIGVAGGAGLTGTVTFYDGQTLLATMPLGANGTAVYTTAALGVGTHQLTATFVRAGTEIGVPAGTVAVVVRPAGGTLLPIVSHYDLIHDETRNHLLIPSDHGTIFRYDVAGGQFLPAIRVSGSPGMGDVTADGKFLYVADRGSKRIHKVNLETGAETVLAYDLNGASERVAGDIVILSNNTAYFTSNQSGSGANWAVRQIDLVTDAITAPLSGPGVFPQGTRLYRSADRSTMLLDDGSENYQSLALYSPGAGILARGTAGWDAWAAVSRDGRYMATSIWRPSTVWLWGAGLQNLTKALPGGPVVFNPTNDILYVYADGTSALRAYDAATLAPLGALAVGELNDPDTNRQGVGVMGASHDGKFVFVGTVSGVRVVWAEPATPGTPTLTAGAGKVNLGAQVTVTAQMPAGVTSGWVTFMQEGGPASSPVAVNAAGTAVHTFAAAWLGARQITAVYSDELGNTGTTSNAVTVTVEKGNPAAVVTLVTTPTPTRAPTFRVSFTPLGHSTLPTGSVSLYDGEVLLGTAPVNGEAVFGLPGPMAGGTHSVRAVYSGDSLYFGTTSAALTFAVEPAASTTGMNLPAAVEYGQMTLLGQVVSAAGQPMTGSMSFYDGGKLLGEVRVNEMGYGQLLLTIPLEVGKHTIIAAYNGSYDVRASVSPPAVLQVNPVVLEMGLQASRALVEIGGAVTLTAQLAGEVPGASIGFWDGNTLLGKAALVNGTATYTARISAAGAHVLKATFDGGGAYAAATSPSVTAAAVWMVDLLAVYTPATLQSHGSPQGVLQNIAGQIASANAAFANSGVPVALRLASLSYVNYGESGDMSTDLDRLGTPNDGHLEEVTHLRNYVGADLVVLLDSRPTPSGGGFYTYGIAYTLTNRSSPRRDEVAYLVIDASAPTGKYLLAHEVAHSLGATHAIGDEATTNGAAPYAHGYRFYGSDGVQYRDIMAYDPGQIIPYFSTPLVSHKGKPIGDAGTADTARVLREQGPLVAKYRTGKLVGSVDVATATAVAGWFWDPRAFDTELTMRVDIDGVTRGTFTAGSERPDLLSAFGTTKHGFSYTLPPLPHGQHAVNVYVQDAAGEWVAVSSWTITTITPLFDEAYYLGMYPDIAAAVKAKQLASGYDHFQRAGQFERRNPSAYFDAAYYLEKNGDLAAAAAKGQLPSPFAHYLAAGQYEGRRASVYFDERFYRLANPDVGTAVRSGAVKSAVEHFLLYGQHEGRSGMPYFDAAYYKANAAGVTGAAYAHFLAAGNVAGAKPSTWFDPAKYLEKNPTVAAAISAKQALSALDHYLRIGRGQGLEFSDAFSEKSYLAKNPDIAAAVKAGMFSCGFEHWVLAGRFEQRQV